MDHDLGVEDFSATRGLPIDLKCRDIHGIHQVGSGLLPCIVYTVHIPFYPSDQVRYIEAIIGALGPVLLHGAPHSILGEPKPRESCSNEGRDRT